MSGTHGDLTVNSATLTLTDDAFRSGDLRLAGGETPDEGRMEIYHDGEWGTVCDDFWTDREADVACRQMKYAGAYRSFDRSRFGGAPASAKIWLDDVHCEGTEDRLADCQHAAWGINNCAVSAGRHLEDAGVQCVPKPAAGTEPGLVFKPATGLQVEAGSSAVYTVRLATMPMHPPERPQMAVRVVVKTDNAHIRVSPDRWWSLPSEWTRGHDITIEATSAAALGQVELMHRVDRTGYPSSDVPDTDPVGKGYRFMVVYTVEVVAAGGSGRRAVGRDAALPGPVAALTATATGDSVALSWTPPQENRPAPIVGYRVERSADGLTGWRHMATVDGLRTSWTPVGLDAASHYYRVSPLTAAGDGPASAPVRAGPSRSSAEEGQLKLTGGHVPWQGRVEVFHSGTWGTVCDDHWGLPDADVACRQAGYEGALQAVAQGAFGAGAGSVVLDNLDCAGTESGLLDCPRVDDARIAEHDCTHTEDAGAVCRAPDFVPPAAGPGATAAVAQGSRLTVQFDAPLAADFLPAPRDFVVLAAGPGESAWREHAVASVSVRGNTLILPLASAVRPDDRIRVHYLRPATQPLLGALRAVPVKPFDDLVATNLSLAEPTNPTAPEPAPAARPDKRERVPGLAEAIADALRGTGSPASLQALDASSREIRSLGGVERLTKLHFLDLSDNALTDLSGLETLPQLRVLDVSGNALTDIWQVASLDDLERLDLGHNRVENAGPLSVLPNLRVLVLDGNAVADLTPLSGLRRLVYLRAADNAIVDIGPLATLDGLLRLDLTGNRVLDPAPLRQLPDLVWLRLAGNRVTQLDALGGMTRLRWVWLEDTPLQTWFGSPWPDAWVDLDAEIVAE